MTNDKTLDNLKIKIAANLKLSPTKPILKLFAKLYIACRAIPCMPQVFR